MKKKVCDFLWRLFLCIYTGGLIFIIVLCVMKPQDSVPTNLMVVYPIVGIIIVMGIATIGSRLDDFLIKYEKVLLIAFFGIYTIATVRFTLHSRGIPVHDSASLIAGAQYMAGLTEEMNWTYFGRWNHNIMPMIFLSYIFRLAQFFHISDGYYLVLSLNIVQVLCTLFCVYNICAKYSKHGRCSAWLGIIMLAIYIPVWGHTQALYTDAFSFGWGIIAFYIWLRNYEKRNEGWKYWLINIGAAIIWGIGYEIKATVVISLIATIIYLLLFESGKIFLKNAVSLLTPVLIIIVVCSAYIKTLPSSEYANTWGVPPVGYFIGVGLEGDGGFNANSEYFLGVTNIWGMEEKKEFSNEFIISNLHRFWDSEHMISKVRHNFATGTMRADDFMQTAHNNGFLYNCISYGGAYREVYRTYVTAYWYMLLEFVVVACVTCLFVKNRNDRKYEASVVIPILTVCGIMLYVMVFEANNRQLYNHIPMIFCVASIGIWAVQNVGEKVFSRIVMKRGKTT